MYTGGNDRQILVWSPSRLIANDMVNPLLFFTLSLLLFSVYSYIFEVNRLSNGAAMAAFLLSFDMDMQDMGPAEDQDNWSD